MFSKIVKRTLNGSLFLVFALTLPLFLLGPASSDGIAQHEKALKSVPQNPAFLNLKNQLTYPTRLAIDKNDNIFVSDIRVGSVFFLDSSLNPKKELKGLDAPMGVGVDKDGRIYVGNKGRGNVEVYGKKGQLLYTLGAKKSEFSMPSDIVVTSGRRVYVVDSKENCVKVYNQVGVRILTIGSEGSGQGEFKFPSTVALSNDETELYVGDQGNYRVHFRRLFRWEFCTNPEHCRKSAGRRRSGGARCGFLRKLGSGSHKGRRFQEDLRPNRAGTGPAQSSPGYCRQLPGSGHLLQYRKQKS